MSSALTNRCHYPLFIVFPVMAMVIFCHHKATATESLVMGKYISAFGTEIVLNLTIQNPAPANLIVEQYLAAENKIIDTSPQAKKVDNSLGNVKWLFKNTRNGILSLSIRLSKPLSGDVRAIVRYRSPQGGAFTELKITP
jgi:hypothetical protein